MPKLNPPCECTERGYDCRMAANPNRAERNILSADKEAAIRHSQGKAEQKGSVFLRAGGKDEETAR